MNRPAWVGKEGCVANEWDRVREAATRVAPAQTWRERLAIALNEAAGAIATGVFICPPGQRLAFLASFVPEEIAPRARELASEFIPYFERRNLGATLARAFGCSPFSFFDKARDRRFTQIVRSDIPGTEGLLTAFLLDEQKETIGWLNLATRRPAREELAAFGEELHQTAQAISETLCSAIDLAVRCGAVLMPPICAALATLSKREREIAQLVAAGFSDLNIGQRLGISENTVGTHLRRVYGKLSLHRRTDLAVMAGSWAVSTPPAAAVGDAMLNAPLEPPGRAERCER
jgi:DNA-binding CsgD family transcriptional regulator